MLGRFTAKFCSIRIGFEKKNEHLKDVHVVRSLFWENQSGSEELEEVPLKLNKTVENKLNSHMIRTPALEIYSKLEKEPGSRKEKKKDIF